MRASRLVGLCSVLLLAGCGGGRPGALYAPAEQYGIDTVDSALTYTSDDTDFTPSRTIGLRIRSPQGATGPLPAVVVIHGGGFNENGFNGLSEWGEHLARAGYVAINFGNTPDEARAHCASLQIPAAECTTDLVTVEVAAGGTIPSWAWTRPNDASAIYDRLNEIEAAAGVQIDRARVAVLGHSAGAHATLSLAGMAVDLSPSLKNRQWLADPRFEVFIANSPQGPDHVGVTTTSWDAIRAPVLIQTGRRDRTEGEEPVARREAFKGLDGPDAFEHYVDDDDSGHGLFALEAHPGTTGNELAVARTAIAFLDAYLRGREEAKSWLAADALSRATDGRSTLSRK